MQEKSGCDALAVFACDLDLASLIRKVRQAKMPAFLFYWESEEAWGSNHKTTATEKLIESTPDRFNIAELLSSKASMTRPFIRELLQPIARPVPYFGAPARPPAAMQASPPSAPQSAQAPDSGAPSAADLDAQVPGIEAMLLEAMAECRQDAGGWILGAEIGSFLKTAKGCDLKAREMPLRKVVEAFGSLFEIRPEDPFAVRPLGWNPGFARPAEDFDDAPPVLTRQQLEAEHESVIVKIFPEHGKGFIRSERRYRQNAKWNNFTFAFSDVLNFRQDDLAEGMRVRFRLMYDNWRSNTFGASLYKAVQITVLQQ
jgi:hypothetical protein